ncbi:MAG: CopD family protein [Betaproteobacteria bacterium]|nr:CopD family protein [Betaproteobacteria bacterium]
MSVLSRETGSWLGKRLGAAAIVALVLSRFSPLTAFAHAELAGSDPPMDGIIERAPPNVTLWLSERPELRFSEIQILDSSARRVDRGDLKHDPIDPLALKVSVGRLDRGTYTVLWRALSSVDGHTTSGAYAFTVGLDVVPTGLAVAAREGATTATPDRAIVGALSYLGLMAAAGAFPFVWWVLLPALAAAAPPLDRARLVRRIGSLGLAATVLAGITGVLGLVAQASSALGVPFMQALGEPSLSVAFGTRFGALWLSQMILLLAMTGLTFRLRGGTDSSLTLAAGSAVGAALLWVQTQGSHSAAAPGATPVAVLVQWVHLLAVATWIGGLMHLVLTAWTLSTSGTGRQATQLAARIVPRFSTLAMVCVIVLVASGVYQGKLLIGTLPALFGTTYGQVLLIKLALFAAAVLLAAANLLILRPRLMGAATRLESAPRIIRALRLAVAGEVVFATLVLVATAALTNLETGREAVIVQGIGSETRDGELLANLRVQPGAAGTNRFVLRLADRTGAPITEVEKVALRVRPRALDLGESEVLMILQPDGRYTAQGGALVAPGPWHVEAVVRRPGRDDARPAFDVTIASPLPPGPLAFAARPEEENPLLGLELVIIGVGVVLATALLRRRVGRYLVPPAVGGIFLGAWVAGSSYATLASVITNPVPPTQASVERGRAIYLDQCALCHGDTGRGDGPAAAGLSPRPADLRVHLAAGHTDAQLFDWVSDGYPGSAMSAFRDSLTEADRWNTLNYIRSAYGPGVPAGR